MKSLFHAFAAACFFSFAAACSTPADSLREVDLEAAQIESSQQLESELAAKMLQSSWIERSRIVQAALDCFEDASSTLTFEITERVYKVFASDGKFYWVVGDASAASGHIRDAEGRSYDVDFAVGMPEAGKNHSGALTQQIRMSVSGLGFVQHFLFERKVEGQSAAGKRENVSEAILAQSESAELEMSEDQTVNSEERDAEIQAQELEEERLTSQEGEWKLVGPDAEQLECSQAG